MVMWEYFQTLSPYASHEGNAGCGLGHWGEGRDFDIDCWSAEEHMHRKCPALLSPLPPPLT